MKTASKQPCVLTVIPARLASVRFPEKLLAEIHGKPIIYWVSKRVQEFELSEFVVATDSSRIADVCKEFSFPYMMTSPSCRNGTERVFEVSQKRSDFSYFLNVQGDEPLVNLSVLESMLSTIGDEDHSFKVAITETNSEPNDTSEAKVAIQSNGRIRYVSRESIPFHRDTDPAHFRIQGVFLYTAEVLTRFVEAPLGRLEEIERLEQLRCIENDIHLQGILTEESPRSVDTFEDLEFFRAMPKHLFER